MKEKVGGRRFEEGLNTKVILDIYKRFGKSVEFKKYLHGVCDAGSRLLFKFRSGTHGLNQGWANFSERGPDETFGSSPRAEITNKNPEVTIT